MANFEIKNPPEYTEEVRMFETTDKGHASVFNSVIGKLINNHAFLKNLSDKKIDKTEKAAADGLATLKADGKLQQRVDYGNLDDAPETWPGSVIVQDNNYRFMSDAEKNTWNGKAAGSHSHLKSQITDFPDSLPADGGNAATVNGHTVESNVPSGAKFTDTLYAHPSNHPPGIIAQDGDNRFVSDTEKNTWNGKAAGSHSHAYTSITDRPAGLDSGYVGTGRESGTVIGEKSTAEGSYTTASGKFGPHAEGSYTTASGASSHAEGSYTTASGASSHAEGGGTTASGRESHAEGGSTIASGNYSHAEGCMTKASGNSNHAEGYGTTASGDFSHAAGEYTVACGQQYVIGISNVRRDDVEDRFIIGGGEYGAPKNCFRVHSSGTVFSTGAYNTSGADYAEYFQWLDGNPQKEDRIGYFVTLAGEGIKIAAEGDYILGAVSGTASVIGNSYDDQWNGRELYDDWGRVIMENYSQAAEYREITNEDGTTEQILIHSEMSGVRPKINPDYNLGEPYTGRSVRPEWDAIGMLGVLTVREDGTCQENGYCKVTGGGTATSSDTGYRVIKRVADNIVKIVFRQ